MKLIRTFPQPDSPAPNIGPRERALAAMKYVGNLEPEVRRTPEGEKLYARLLGLYQTEVTPELGALTVLGLVLPGDEPASDDHPMYPCLVHSFRQEARRRRGEPLASSVVPQLRG